MHNYFTIETEAEARRHAFQREAAADARAAGATQTNPMRRWLPWFARSAATASARSLPAMPVGVLLEMPRVPRPVAC
jgi:hypothetical protein